MEMYRMDCAVYTHFREYLTLLQPQKELYNFDIFLLERKNGISFRDSKILMVKKHIFLLDLCRDIKLIYSIFQFLKVIWRENDIRFYKAD